MGFLYPSPYVTNFVPPYIQISEEAIEIGDRKENLSGVFLSPFCFVCAKACFESRAAIDVEVGAAFIGIPYVLPIGRCDNG